ncbi:30S ribosomal protein S8 [Candidatus Woesearchaeota archaeon]|nr:30S ribosomal protein S8 [Candidatus Woesearchaeota archaeon]
MSMNDPLANVLSKIMNAENRERSECIIKPVSKLIKKVLEILSDEGYIGEVKEIEDNKGNMLQVALLGKINKLNVIKPRFFVKKDGYEKFEKRYLPSNDFGVLIVSTPSGLKTNKEAEKKETGGRLIAYVY